MKHSFLITILALLAATAWAGEKSDSVVVTGNVLDSFTREYLDSVSVELLSPISGELICSTLIFDWVRDIADETQRRQMERWNPVVKRRIYTLKARPGTYILRLNCKGYMEKEQNITIPARRYGRRTETWEVKDVLLDKNRSRLLDEAMVKTTKIKMMAKGDTLIYNADAFQLADGSMLDGLIAMMPGLEIRNGSQIYQNGEYIPELLVNGKDFFNGDPAIALRNLPAYTVKDLRIYHRAPDGAYLLDDLTHDDTLKWNKVLDVRLKRQYNHGWITNAEVAGGPAFAKDAEQFNGVYMARLFGMHFSDHSRLGVFGNFNNMNDTGLAGSDGDWRDSWTPENGVTTMQLGALDFTVDGKKSKLSYNLNTQAVREVTESEIETSSTSFLNAGDVFSRSRRQNTHDRFHFVLNNTFKWNGKKATFFFKPGFDFFRRNNDGQSLTAQFSDDPMDSYRGAALDSVFTLTSSYLSPASPRLQKMLVNRTSTLYASREDLWWEVVRLGTSFKSPVTGHLIDISLYQQYQHSNLERREQYDLRTYGSAPANNYQNRYILMPSNSFLSTLDVTYYLRKFGNFRSQINYNYKKVYTKNHRDYYRLERLGDDWADPEQTYNLSDFGSHSLPSTTDWRTLAIDADNSYRAENNKDFHQITPILNYSGKRISFNLHPNIVYSHERRADTRGEQASMSRRSVLFSPSAFISYRYKALGRKKKESSASGNDKGNLSLSYAFSQDTPDLSYLLNIRDASNPLSITMGNPLLRNSTSHSLRLSQTYYGSTRSVRSGIGYSRHQRLVAQGRSYNPETGVYTYRPENVDGNWSTSGSFHLTLTPRNTPFSFSTGSSINYNHNVDLISPDNLSNAVLSIVHNITAIETLKLTYTKDKITASLHASATLIHANSEREGFHKRTTREYNYGASFVANKFWLGLSFATQLTMNHLRGYDDPSMNENTLVWNAELSRSFGHQKQWGLRLTGHDLLRQLSNTRRVINAQGITETWTNSLPSYTMLHISYRWNKNPKK